MKFSNQDATLAAAYSQLAASALGLSSIWIGMFDEEKVKEIIGTELRPTSILCIGYPIKKRPAKLRRQLKELIHVVDKKDQSSASVFVNPDESSENILTSFSASFSMSRPGSAEIRSIFVVIGNGKLIKITLSRLDAM